MKRLPAVGLALLALSCSGPITELVVVVHSDLSLERLEVTIDSVEIDGETRSSTLPAEELPGSVGVVHGGGPLGPLRVRASGSIRNGGLVERSARVRFVAGQSRRIDLYLGAACRDVQCARGETCALGECVDDARETRPFDGEVGGFDAGRLPDAGLDAGADAGGLDAGLDGGPAVDAGPDACVPSDEVCNGRDDDCDLSTDEQVVSVDDPLHCGACGRACAAGEACDGRACAGEPTAIAIYSGGACAVAGPTREVHCWGANSQHQFGIGTTGNSDHPVANGLTDVVQLAAGETHVCALDTQGQVFCWGSILHGRLGHAGDGTTPARVVLPSAREVVVTLSSSCALLEDGRVFCWGRNHLGQLAQPSVTATNIAPTDVGLVGVTAIGAGHNHVCAALASGAVQCWGYNHQGQVDPTGGASRFEPTAVSGVSGDAVAIDGGEAFSCVLFASGRMSCWGHNNRLQLADEPTSLQPGPRSRDFDRPPLGLSLGSTHGCALSATGDPLCWGNNAWAQLGRPAGVPVSDATPTSLLGRSYRLVAAGWLMTCGRLDDGEVECRGRGSLGDGMGVRTSPSPARVMLP